MKGIVRDIKTAVGLFGEIRKARDEGKEIEVRHLMKVPYISGHSFMNTVEGCLFSNCTQEILNAAQAAFSALSDDEKHRLEFSPKEGEFIERVKFWGSLLRPALPDKQYRIAMGSLLHWYIHMKNMRVDTRKGTAHGKD